MTTPNIKELIDRLYDWHNTSAEQNRLDMQKAADLLQSQAEHIKELEEAAEESSADAVIIQYHEAAIKRLKIENDTLRAQLSAIAATEPVLVVEKEPDYWSGGHFHEGSKPHIKPTKVWCLPIGTQLFTRPMPAQDVTELVEALEKLARLGNGEHYGNSDGNMIARDALSKYKGAK